MYKFLFCLLVSLVYSTILQAQTLHIAVQKGQKYKVENSSQMTSSGEINGEAMSNSYESSTTFIYHISDISKHQVELKQTFARFTNQSNFMGTETSYDSDKKENTEPPNEAVVKRIGKSKKIVIDLNGYIIKEEKIEPIEETSVDWGWMDATGSWTELFLPELLGKELRPGFSFPVVKSIRKEKPSASFSLNKESLTVADSGTFTVTIIRDGIATISYTGLQTMTMIMKMDDMPVNNITSISIQSEFKIDMNTGLLLESNTTQASVVKDPNTGLTSSFSMKGKTTSKLTWLE